MTIYKMTDACCEETLHCFELQYKLQRSYKLAAKISQMTEDQLDFIANEIAFRYGLCDAYYMSFSLEFIGEQATVRQLALSFLQDIRNDVSTEHRKAFWSNDSEYTLQLDKCIRDCFENFLVVTDDFLADATSSGISELAWQCALYDDVMKLTEILELLVA